MNPEASRSPHGIIWSAPVHLGREPFVHLPGRSSRSEPNTRIQPRGGVAPSESTTGGASRSNPRSVTVSFHPLLVGIEPGSDVLDRRPQARNLARVHS